MGYSAHEQQKVGQVAPYLYPIRDDISIMLIDESIPMEQIG